MHAVKRDWALVQPEDRPVFAYFERDKKIPDKFKDAFLLGGSMAISKELRDVMLQFDLGQTQFFEVPIHADEHGTPTDLPNYFMMNVHAPKDTLIIEKSKDVSKPKFPGVKLNPNTKYRADYCRETVAAKASAAEGADLWHDPILRGRFFMSDRLKEAIEAANINIDIMEIYAAPVFEPV